MLCVIKESQRGGVSGGLKIVDVGVLGYISQIDRR